jgi:hypothetical protein
MSRAGRAVASVGANLSNSRSIRLMSSSDSRPFLFSMTIDRVLPVVISADINVWANNPTHVPSVVAETDKMPSSLIWKVT